MDEWNCPHCNADLRGDPIDDRYFEHKDDCPLPEGTKAFPGQCFCLPYGERAKADRFYKRTIAVEIPGVYDGALFYMCPDCGGRWHRWDHEQWPEMWHKAEPYVTGGKDIGYRG